MGLQDSSNRYAVMLQKASMAMLSSPADLHTPEAEEEQQIQAELHHRLRSKMQASVLPRSCGWMSGSSSPADKLL